jgi:ABC-type Fe3+-hydroxamate transport system substrate-binding protein
MKTINLTILTATMLSIFGLMTACQTTVSSKKKSTEQAVIKTTDNKSTPEPVKAETPERSIGSLSTPTETYKTAFAARQKKDVKALKLVL